MSELPSTVRKYTCALCHGEFESDWSEKEALAEKQNLWGDIPINEMEVVCDDCFKMIGLPEGAKDFVP